MKKVLYILLVTILTVITISTISNASSNRYIATDKNIFGENALVVNVKEDQSQKLEQCIKKAAIDKKELFIPAGKYYINKSVMLKTSDINIIGDKDNATILINKENKPDILFDADNYIKNMENIRIENIFFDGIQIRIRDKNNVKIENNIFYNSNGEYIIFVFCGKNTNINHNIFLRDKEHASIHEKNARTIYVGGYAWEQMYRWAENATISDNIIGAKINELDAIKSLQQENKQNIVRLQKAIKGNKISLKNEQNYITTGVNSYCNLKNAYIEDNVFYSNYDDQEWDKNPIEHDHATYLRGSQKVYISGNHMRGFQNGTIGGFKFKSGRDIVIVNNYIRNSSIILANRPEYGLTDTIKEGETSQFTRILIANNIFDFKQWQRTYAIGIHSHTDNPEKMPTKIDGVVIIENKYINYMNIAPKPREGIQLADKTDPNLYNYKNTYIKGNTRDDTEDKKLTSWRWKNNEEALLSNDWRPILSKEPSLEAYYNKKKNIRIPFLNMLATAVPTTVNIEEEIKAENLVKNVYDKDNKKPTYIITNKEELNTPGQKEIIVKIKYQDQVPEVNITVPVTVVGKVEENKKKDKEEKEKNNKEDSIKPEEDKKEKGEVKEKSIDKSIIKKEKAGTEIKEERREKTKESNNINEKQTEIEKEGNKEDTKLNIFQNNKIELEKNKADNKSNDIKKGVLPKAGKEYSIIMILGITILIIIVVTNIISIKNKAK